MSDEIITLYSEHNLIISEDNSNNDVLDAKFIICDFNPNGNDVTLNRNTIDDWLSTLLIKPLVGKVISKFNGNKDFSDHNAKVVEKEDEEGNKYQNIEFDTSAFGSFYSTGIETIDDKEYIVANAKIWKRFTQAYDVIKRRIDSDKGIKTSWEIKTSAFHYEVINGKNTKVIDKGTFTGHCLLGETVKPAYASSGMLAVASINEFDYELTDALIKDVQTTSKELKGKEELEKMPKDNETSALNIRDLSQKICSALNPKGWNSNPYYSVVSVYPEEHKFLAYDFDRETEDEYISASYSVVDDNVTIGEMVITQQSKMLSEQIQEKDEALVTASEKILQLQSTVDELIPFKEKVVESERLENEKILSTKIEELKLIATKGGLITKEEIETSEEIKTMISSLDVKGINALIGDRFVKSQKLDTANKTIETSDLKVTNGNTRKNISDGNDILDHKQVMSSFFKNK